MRFSRTFVVLLLTIFISACSNNNTEFTELMKQLEQIQQHAAPDKRVAVFTYEIIKKDGQTKILIETDQPEVKSQLSRLQTTGVNDIEVRFLPDSSVIETPYGLISNSVANIRSNPKYSAEQVTQAVFGTPVKILKREGGWYLIQTPEKYLGWTERLIVNELSRDAYKEWLAADKLIVTEETPIYSEAESTSLIAKHVVKGSILVQEGSRSQKMIRVKLGNNKKGFIPFNTVQSVSTWLKNRSFSVDDIIETSKTLLGRPYMWGGTSTKAMDCSGFTKTVYYLNGYQLPRDASQQVFAGTLVSKSVSDYPTFKKGDFLFFGTRGTDGKKDKVVHVAIYLGEGKFINASGEIKIESLNKEHEDYNEYRFNTFLQARTMNPADDSIGIVPVEKAWERL